MARACSTSLTSTNLRASSLISWRVPRVSTPRRSLVVRAGLEDIINNVTVAIQKSPLAQGKKAFAKMQAGNYDVDATKKKMEEYINGNPVMVFSFSTCPFCVKAKKILDASGARYTAIELDQLGPEGMALRAELAELTGRTSMPNIWIGRKGIGGCNDGPGIVTLQNNGELEGMLRAAGAL